MILKAIADAEFERRGPGRLLVAQEVPEKLELRGFEYFGLERNDLADTHQTALLPGGEAWEIGRAERLLIVVFECARCKPGVFDPGVRKGPEAHPLTAQTEMADVLAPA